MFEMLSTVPAVREFSNNPEMPDDNNEDTVEYFTTIWFNVIITVTIIIVIIIGSRYSSVGIVTRLR
jgi:hypothetical protein